MATPSKTLSPRSARILELLAVGHSYEQVLASDPALTYLDILAAAREALEVAGHYPPAGVPAASARHNVMEFYGQGHASWDGTDAQAYVDELREEWDHRP